MEKTISRTDLGHWLADLARRQVVWAPVQDAGVVTYRPLTAETTIDWDAAKTTISPKGTLFPPTETLFTMEISGDQVRMTEAAASPAQLLFGIRPCDAQGILALDALFLETEPVDHAYASRREATVLVGIACRKMGPTCFCTSVGGGPDDARGMDVMLYESVDLEDSYVIVATSARGEALVATLPWQAREAVAAQPVTRDTPPAMPPAAAWPAHFAGDFWADTAERCLGCRICAYVCPTCRCFDVRDESRMAANGNGNYERIRCWDSCSRDGYRRIAGGHNPRAASGERLRNRILCKFHYFPEQYGPVACTGCGRCIDACPVNIDITEIWTYLVEVSP
jgi:ferredoxin